MRVRSKHTKIKRWWSRCSAYSPRLDYVAVAGDDYYRYCESCRRLHPVESPVWVS